MVAAYQKEREDVRCVQITSTDVTQRGRIRLCEGDENNDWQLRECKTFLVAIFHVIMRGIDSFSFDEKVYCDG